MLDLAEAQIREGTNIRQAVIIISSRLNNGQRWAVLEKVVEKSAEELNAINMVSRQVVLMYAYDLYTKAHFHKG